MKIEEHMKFWLDSADHDLEAAESLFNALKFDWRLFLGHLVLEKALKAVYVRDNANEMPPRTHNLVKLAEATNLKLDEESILFLDEITYFNIEVRYPDYKNEFYKKCTRSFCEEKLGRIKDFLQWIKKDIQSDQL
jgi:HEPN domain-containing protein